MEKLVENLKFNSNEMIKWNGKIYNFEVIKRGFIKAN